jgi:hypothetical protein
MVQIPYALGLMGHPSDTSRIGRESSHLNCDCKSKRLLFNFKFLIEVEMQML